MTMSLGLTASGYPAQIAEVEKKLSQVQAKLDEIENAKVLEPKVRKELASLTAKLEELQEGYEADKKEKIFLGKEDEIEEAAPEPVQQAPAKPRTSDDERKAKMKAINKKLKQIEGLKAKDDLDAEQKAKVANEPKLKKQLAAVEAGQPFVDSDDEKEAAPAANFKKAPVETKVPAASDDGSDDATAKSQKLPSDPAEREKRTKILKKKLQQIAKLKEKGGDLDGEAKQKIAGEDRVNQEIAALDAGKDEVVFVDKAPEDPKMALEKQVKAINKKLEQIAKLKEASSLDADGKAKVASEAGLKKDLGHAQFEVAQLNKVERERVAAKLGWEAEQKKKGGK